MRKLIPFVFLIIAAVLAYFIFSKNLFSDNEGDFSSNVVIPIMEGESDGSLVNSDDFFEARESVAFINLNADEILVSTVELDIDSDGSDDQIVFVKSIASPAIIAIAATYNPQTTKYQREASFLTEISQSRTFAATSLDVLGKHKNSLVYQGLNDEGKMIMKILSVYRDKNSKIKTDVLGDFSAEGTIFIQQSQRSEGYELNGEKGESFPVWVYSSENGSLDQIQTLYEWNESEKKYVASRTIRVAGNKIAAKELAKIQDGTVSSFANFLDGLWYKTENNGEMRYLYFDYENSEIIFQLGDSEEIYSWLTSNVRRNGIYFSSVNKSIENLQRQFDISLIGMDEIQIKIQDDVRMLISEGNLWDGRYKKYTQELKKSEKKVNECFEALTKTENWISADGTIFKFTGNDYAAEGERVHDNGRVIQTEVKGQTLFQFRSDGEIPYFGKAYLPSFLDKNPDNLVLQSVVMNLSDFYPEQVPPIILKKYVPPKPEEENIVEEKKEEVQAQLEIVTNSKNPELPSLSLKISPQYFSPDGDGEFDEMTIELGASSKAGIKNWSFVVNNPESVRPFWTISGKSDFPDKIVWNGKSSKGELVQSATDYPFVYTVTDNNGVTNTTKGFVQIDVLVIKEGSKLKMQVPSIIFRGDAADFKSDEEVKAMPDWNKVSRGLDQRTIENNIRILSRIVEILTKFQDYKVTIEGNASNLTGTKKEEEEVVQLSGERARFVMNWLIQEGISPARLSYVGNGSKYMLVSPSDKENRWKNRRVEFILRK